MRTYAALAGVNDAKLLALGKSEYPYLLVSFMYQASTMPRLPHTPSALMLDSGAFTAHTLGREVVLADYIGWALEMGVLHPQVRVTNLDVIPPKLPTRRERNRVVKQSAENAETMRAAGLRVCEVHHLWDPIEAFEEMMERRREGEALGVAGLAARKDADPDTLARYGSGVFARLRDRHGWEALPPVHGFGVALTQIAYRYPLASIDATSWISPDRFGQVLKRGGTGRLVKPSDESRRRLKQRDVNGTEMRRILDSWLVREREVAKYWADRGVKILEEGGALVEPAAV